jgi:hypothetical protein
MRKCARAAAKTYRAHHQGTPARERLAPLDMSRTFHRGTPGAERRDSAVGYYEYKNDTGVQLNLFGFRSLLFYCPSRGAVLATLIQAALTVDGSSVRDAHTHFGTPRARQFESGNALRAMKTEKAVPYHSPRCVPCL